MIMQDGTAKTYTGPKNYPLRLIASDTVLSEGLALLTCWLELFYLFGFHRCNARPSEQV